MKKRKDLTEADINQIVDLYSYQKKSLLFISSRLDTSSSTVRNVLIERGIEPRCPSKAEGGSIKSRLEKRFDAGEHDVEALTKELGCSIGHAMTCYKEWKKKHDPDKDKPFDFMKARFGEYLTMDKLDDFARNVQIGDHFKLRKPGSNDMVDSYMFTHRKSKEYDVKILAKYTNFAMTDHGAVQWVDLWDSAKRFGKCDG